MRFGIVWDFKIRFGNKRRFGSGSRFNTQPPFDKLLCLFAFSLLSFLSLFVPLISVFLASLKKSSESYRFWRWLVPQQHFWCFYKNPRTLFRLPIPVIFASVYLNSSSGFSFLNDIYLLRIVCHISWLPITVLGVCLRVYSTNLIQWKGKKWQRGLRLSEV